MTGLDPPPIFQETAGCTGGRKALVDTNDDAVNDDDDDDNDDPLITSSSCKQRPDSCWAGVRGGLDRQWHGEAAGIWGS
jgi:hypothetical protein